jgi:Glycosyltransferase
LQGIGIGGVSSVILNYYRMLTDEIQADFIVIVPFEHIPSTIREELECNGCKIYHVTPFVKNMLKYRKEVAQIIHQGDYDIIHDNNKYFAFLSLNSAKKAGITTRICHVHNTVAAKEKSILHNLFIRVSSKLSVRYATELLACSDEAGKSMYGSRSFTILYNAIDVNKYKFNDELRTKWRKGLNINKDLVIAMVARKDIIKRYDHAFRIFAEIYKVHRNASFLAIGIDEKNCEARDLQVYYELPDDIRNRIHLLGRRMDANELLNAADVFVLTSEHEGLGIVVIEAQANGLLCYVSQGVPREVDIAGIVHFLPTLGDPSYWAKEICSQKCGFERLCYSDIVEKSEYSIDNAVNSLKRIYNIC